MHDVWTHVSTFRSRHFVCVSSITKSSPASEKLHDAVSPLETFRGTKSRFRFRDGRGRPHENFVRHNVKCDRETNIKDAMNTIAFSRNDLM